ncbi:MAG TPA: ATP-binding protein [Azospira sp.]|nr:ATP-binding protein [Azospira sp.]
MTEDRPENFQLRRYFSIASGILMLAVVLPLAYAYYHSEVAEHTELAGVRNEALAKTYANTLWPEFGDFLLRTDLSAEARRRHETTELLHRRIRQMSRDAAVIKIKAYNRDGIAVYSSVLEEIGEDKSRNAGFVAASAGQLINELTHRGTMSASEGEIENVDVVSTYIPVRLAPDEPARAVFELYSNVTETVARIESVTVRLLITLSGVFLVLYLCLLGIVAHADRILQRQYLAIRDNEARLQAKKEQLEREILERQEIERALRASEKVAEAASRAKSDFLSGMSHELRTPMNSILGFTQLLESEPGAPLSESQQKFARQIMKAGSHLLALIDQILDLSRIEAGKLVLSLEPVQLRALLDESLPMIQHLAEKRQLAPIRVAVDELRVVADYGRLKQVMLNLLSNAIKYNRAGGSVSVTAAAADERGDCVRIAVTDTGSGIPAERLGELFQPFSRLGVNSADVEGTGIGLVLTRRMVEAMGGTIGVDSAPGRGSTFWLTLPAAPAAHPAAADGSAAERPPDGSATATAPADDASKTVLYIEDNPANMLLMEELIRRLPGVRLLCAHNGEIGIALAQQERPELIIMDINLPGMNGFDTLAALRRDPALAATPAIALSANARPSDIERGVAAGFKGYYTKPIQIDVFSRAIGELLAGGRHDVV